MLILPHDTKRNHDASVVSNLYDWVAIAYLYQPSPQDNADVKSRLQRSDTSLMPPKIWFSSYAVNSWPMHIYAIHKTSKWDMHRFGVVITFLIMTI